MRDLSKVESLHDGLDVSGKGMIIDFRPSPGGE